MSTRRLAAVLALLELCIAVYLEVERARGRSVACPIGGGGCEKVQESRYSKLAGVPLPILGLIGADGDARDDAAGAIRARAWSRSCSPLAGALFSLYLAALQAFEINAYCAWCLSSAVIWIALAVTTGVACFRLADEE